MRTVSAAELSRLADGRGAKVAMTLPAEAPPPPMPAPPPNNDKLADAVLQLGTLLAAAVQSMARPQPAAPAPMPAPELPIWAGAMPPQIAAPAAIERAAVGKFVVKTDPDGLLLSVTAGGASYEIRRDEDGAGEQIVRRSGAGTTTYRIERGRGGRITAASLIA